MPEDDDKSEDPTVNQMSTIHRVWGVMTWYPSVDDVIYANFTVLALSDDKHPHKLLRSLESIQAVIDRLVQTERLGINYQAAQLTKDLVNLHAFAGGNHRTAFVVVCLFLKQNGTQMRIERFSDAYDFIRDVETKSIEQIQEWIEHGHA